MLGFLARGVVSERRDGDMLSVTVGRMQCNGERGILLEGWRTEEIEVACAQDVIESESVCKRVVKERQCTPHQTIACAQDFDLLNSRREIQP